MNEQRRRILVAAEARAYGRGGVQTLAQITGMSRQTIYRGLQDLRAKQKKPSGRIRRPGGGHKRLCDQYPRLVETLERLIEPTVLWTAGRRCIIDLSAVCSAATQPASSSMPPGASRPSGTKGAAGL